MKKLNLFRRKSSGAAPETHALDVLLRDFAQAENADLPLNDIRRKIDDQILLMATSAPQGSTAAGVSNLSDTGRPMTQSATEKAAEEAKEHAAQKAAEEQARQQRQKTVSEAEMRAAIAAAAAAGTPLAATLTPPAPAVPAPTPKASALADETAQMQTQAVTQQIDSAVTNVKAAKAAAKAAKENAKLAQQNAKKAARAARAQAQKAFAATPSTSAKAEKKGGLSFLQQFMAKKEQRLLQAEEDELRTRRLQKPTEEPKKPFVKQALRYAPAAAGVVVLCVAAFAFRDSIFPTTDQAAPAAKAPAAAPAEAMLTYDMEVAEEALVEEPESAASIMAEAPVTAAGSAENGDGGKAMPDSGLLISGAEMEGSLEMMLLTADTDYVCYGTLTDSQELVTQYGDTIFLIPGGKSAPKDTQCLFFLKLTEPGANTYTILQAFPEGTNDALAQEAFLLFPYTQETPPAQ